MTSNDIELKRGMSRDERLMCLCQRMFTRWIANSPLLDRKRWNRWMNRAGL